MAAIQKTVPVGTTKRRIINGRMEGDSQWAGYGNTQPFSATSPVGATAINPGYSLAPSRTFTPEEIAELDRRGVLLTPEQRWGSGYKGLTNGATVNDTRPYYDQPQPFSASGLQAKELPYDAFQPQAKELPYDAFQPQAKELPPETIAAGTTPQAKPKTGSTYWDYLTQSNAESNATTLAAKLAGKDASLEDMQANQKLRRHIATYLGTEDKAAIDKEIATLHGESTPTIKTMMKDMGEAAGSAVTSMAAGKSANAANQYASDMQYWKDQGKYWFDPDADLAPDLDAYLKEMPSATDALLDSTLTGETLSKDTPVSNTGLGITTAGIGLAFKDKEQAAHIISKSGERSLEMGPMLPAGLGYALGGVIGIVEGALGWASAKKADAAEAKKARAEYDKKMRVWQYRRNKRLREQREAYLGAVQQKKNTLRATEKAEKATAKEKKRADTIARRQAMMNAIVSASALGDANRTKRANLWR